MEQIIRLSISSDYSSFLSKFDTFLLDCDGAIHITFDSTDILGVIWDGDHLLPKVKQTISYLRSQNKRLIFVTNSSSKSRRVCAKKFITLGIPVDENEIFGSGYSAAIYLSRILCFPHDKKVYLLGERGLEEELEIEGIPYIGRTNGDYDTDFESSGFDSIVPDHSVGAVLYGKDFHITYKKLAKALTYLLQSPDVLFLATSLNSTGPFNGKIVPGAGTTTTIPLQYASKWVATSCGKSSQIMMDAICAKYELDRERMCMIGDRLDMDIKFGIQGILGGTLLVLTDISSLQDCMIEDIYPNFVINSFGELADAEKK